MNQTLRAEYIKKLHEQIGVLGPQFELFAGRFLRFHTGLNLDNRGLSLLGQPVGGTIDGASTCGTLAWEASADGGYFKGRRDKFWNDLRHAHETHRGAKRIALLAGATMPATQQAALMRVARRVHKAFGKELEILDARAIATKLVDDQLDNDLAVDTLSAFLPALRDIKEENAWSHSIPRLARTYLSRGVEADLEADLAQQGVAVVAGIGGVGKSQVCAAIAHRASSRYDSVIWVDAADLGRLENLESHTLERLGRPRNILALLRRRRCLLILDDLRTDAAIDALRELAGRSSILVSRRTLADGVRVVPPMDESEARTLLCHDVAACPDAVFQRLWRAIGGHPLSLALLNATAKRGTSWEDLGHDADAIGTYPDEKEQRLADRLLARLATTMAKEVALFRWCESASCDVGFARATIGNIGLRKLTDSCLLAVHEGHVVRLHDVVFSSVQQLMDSSSTDFGEQFALYIRNAAHRDDALVVLARTHVDKLARLIGDGNTRPEFRYAFAIGAEPEQLDPHLLGDPAAMAEDCKNSSASTLSIAVDVVLEAVEALYRRTKSVEGVDAAKRALQERLDVFAKLDEATATAAPELQMRVSHHRAKALKLLGRADDALAVFEALLAGGTPSHAVRLQVIRLLMKTDPTRAEGLIREVLEASRATDQVSSSVALAVVKEIRRLSKAKGGELLDAYGDHIAARIRGSIRSHPDESLAAFAAVASHWAWNDPQRFVALWRGLPPADPSGFEKDEGRAAYADTIGEAAARIDLSDVERARLQEDALALYDSLDRPSAYQLRNRGKLLVQMQRFDDAIRQLVVIDDPKGETWVRYWLSKAHLALGHGQEALAEVDKALLAQHPANFESSLLSQRAACRKALHDARAIDDARAAVAACEDDGYRGKLEVELATIEAELGPSRA